VLVARQTFAYGYMEAISDPKTTVFSKAPQRLSEEGILEADGVEHEHDLVIAAIGYDQPHMPHFPKLVNGNSITEPWSDPMSPPSYIPLCLKGMPNYLDLSSAYGPLPQGNYYQSSEAFIKYIVKAIHKMQIDRIMSITPKDKAVDQFARHANAYLNRTAVTGPCVAWYQGNENRHRLRCGLVHEHRSSEYSRHRDLRTSTSSTRMMKTCSLTSAMAGRSKMIRR